MMGTFNVYALLYSHPEEVEGRSVRSSPPTVGPGRGRRPGVLAEGDHAIHHSGDLPGAGPLRWPWSGHGVGSEHGLKAEAER